MAITANGGVSNSGSGSASSASVSTTVSAGSDQILVAHMATGSDQDPMDHSSGTFNGDALTEEVEQDRGPHGAFDWINVSSLWYRLAPDQTTANTTINFTSATDVDWAIQAGYLDGAKQQAPETSNSTTDDTSPIQISDTTLTANAGVVGGACHDDTTATAQASFDSDFGEDYPGVMSFAIEASADAHTWGWTLSSSQPSALTVMVFEEAGAGGGGGANVPAASYHHRFHNLAG